MSASLLIVEDERSSREYLRLLLEEEGHQTTLAANGVEAMVALERDAFDLLISDLHMPEMDGRSCRRRRCPSKRWTT